MAGLVKAPINAVIAIINGAISGINAVGFTIPDWVPVLGGKDFRINVPTIPMLEKGSNYTPETFIAGDVGGKGGELVTNAQGRKVFTAAQTDAIFDNINKARAVVAATSSTPDAMPSLMERVGGFFGSLRAAAGNRAAELDGQTIATMPTSGGGGETQFVIQYSPTIYVDGDKAGDIDDKLKQSNETLLQMFKDFLRQQREDERRMGYA